MTTLAEPQADFVLPTTHLSADHETDWNTFFDELIKDVIFDDAQEIGRRLYAYSGHRNLDREAVKALEDQVFDELLGRFDPNNDVTVQEYIAKWLVVKPQQPQTQP